MSIFYDDVTDNQKQLVRATINRASIRLLKHYIKDQSVLTDLAYIEKTEQKIISYIDNE